MAHNTITFQQKRQNVSKRNCETVQAAYGLYPITSWASKTITLYPTIPWAYKTIYISKVTSYQNQLAHKHVISWLRLHDERFIHFTFITTYILLEVADPHLQALHKFTCSEEIYLWERKSKEVQNKSRKEIEEERESEMERDR